jgi:phosphoglycolate phosphatase
VNGQLVVFDLDGTLIDSQRDLADSANRMLALYGAGPLPMEAVGGMVGDGAKVLVERALAAAGLNPAEPEALRRFLDIYDEQLLVHTRPYPGVVEALEGASSLAPLGVLTNKPERPTNRLLEALGFSPFIRWAIGGDSGYPRKPAPASLLSLITMAGARPETTLYVGDSLVDVLTARGAGSRLCLARYGFGQLRGPVRLQEGEWALDDPRELAGTLGQFLGQGIRT